MNAPQKSRLESFVVFLFLLALYLAFSGDRYEDFPASDEWIMFRTTVAMVDERSLRPRLDERYVGQEAKYGLGQSLAAVPLYLLARALVGPMPNPPSPEVAADFERVFARWKAVAFPLACATNAVICAALGAMFFAIGCRMGVGKHTALAGAMILGTATIVAPYSKSFFSEPLVALGLLGAAGAVAGPIDDARWRRTSFRVGAWLALAILARTDNIVLLPVFLATLWLGVRSPLWRKGLAWSVFFVIPLACMALFIAWTNHVRSGSILGGGYQHEGFSTPFLTGLFGLLFSPSRGVFWFSPPLIAALPYLVRFHRRHPRLCFAIFATVAIKLFLFAKWWNWFGGWSWGSRFLLPLVPLVMLVLLEPLSRWSELRRMEKALIGVARVVGIVVQLCGLLVPPNQFHNNIQFLAGAGSGRIQPLADREQLLMFSPPQSPLTGNWPIIAHGQLDWFAARFGQFFPPHLVLPILVTLAVALVVSALGLVYLRMRAPREATAGQSALPIGEPRPSVVRRTAWLLVGINVVLLAVLSVSIGANGVWRFEEEASWLGDKRSQPREHLHSLDSCVFLDDTVYGPKRSTRWSGWLEVPVSGAYSFYAVVWGALEFRLGEQVVLSNPDDARFTAARRSLRGDVELRRGIYPFHLAYGPVRDGGDRAIRWRRQIHLYWTIPGGGEYEQIIGRSWLYPDPPGAAHRLITQLYRLKVGFIIVSLLVLWWVWLYCALCPCKAES